MKKTVFLICLFWVKVFFTAPVPLDVAKTVAINFFQASTRQKVNSISINYIETLNSSTNYIYVFNINKGFIIVSADDRGFPVLGYSPNNTFSIQNELVKVWIRKRAEELKYSIDNNILPSEKISNKWNQLKKNNSYHPIQNQKTTSNTFVLPLLQTTWNQSPYYNDLCPGGSVTGCVATAMSQIMRYWCFPPTGTGSSSYVHPTYGTLSANYGATTYSWSQMPNAISSSNNAVAIINYHAGVSVEMDYSPSGSGAWVIAQDNPVCAQTSYTNYFRYDPSQIHGEYKSDYSDSIWIVMLKNDLNLSRPIQYVGWDTSAGGHTWVCDGYDINDFFHMNWGWGGASDGYYDINNLNGGFPFNYYQEGLFGIVPTATALTDACLANTQDTILNFCTNQTSFNPKLRLQSFGTNNLTYCLINYSIDNGPVQTYTWTGNLSVGLSSFINLPSIGLSAGTHTLQCYTSNPNHTIDNNPSNDTYTFIYNVIGSNIPMISEGFENNATFSSNWNIDHVTAQPWQITNNAAATGLQSIMINNAANTPYNVSIFSTVNSINFAANSSPSLTFKLAYQRNNTSNNDKLEVQLSNDCGQTWINRWVKYSSSLATNTLISSSPFIPTANDFITYTVSLGSFATSTDALVRWKFTAGSSIGNNIYIDDININNNITTEITSFNNQSNNFNISPNPASNICYIEYNNIYADNMARIIITDIAGKVVDEQNIPARNGKNIFSLNISNYAKGLYFITLSHQNISCTSKLIVN